MTARQLKENKLPSSLSTQTELSLVRDLGWYTKLSWKSNILQTTTSSYEQPASQNETPASKIGAKKVNILPNRKQKKKNLIEHELPNVFIKLLFWKTTTVLCKG